MLHLSPSFWEAQAQLKFLEKTLELIAKVHYRIAQQPIHPCPYMPTICTNMFVLNGYEMGQVYQYMDDINICVTFPFAKRGLFHCCACLPEVVVSCFSSVYRNIVHPCYGLLVIAYLLQSQQE